MKSERLITALFVAAALILAGAARWIQPEAARPEVFSDQGEPLFPEFRDVLAVKAIEVVGYDEEQAVAQPLKVEFRRGRWVLPSHHDYPAEAADRLAKTAAALLDLKKDIVVSDRIEDHATYGVIDPLDMKVASLAGRGKRVTLRDGQGRVLADVVLGKPDPERQGYRYLRVPGQKRVYSVKTSADPSANFEDWIEGNLLRLAASDIRRITLNRYLVDESLGRLANVERTTITRDGGAWKSEGARQLSRAAIDALTGTLGALRILGVRPKPKPLAEQLRAGKPLEMSLETVMSLRQRGFFITPDGRLLAKEGEVFVETARGLLYTLRFGDIVAGPAAAPTSKAQAAEQDRYLFVTVSYDAARAARYGDGGGDGERLARTLSEKFADWYYVISGKDFVKLHPRS
jgi:hypothetical protein